MVLSLELDRHHKSLEPTGNLSVWGLIDLHIDLILVVSIESWAIIRLSESASDHSFGRSSRQLTNGLAIKPRDGRCTGGDLQPHQRFWDCDRVSAATLF